MSQLGKWLRRIFDQWDNEEDWPTARELGFNGVARDVPLDDQHRLDALVDADNGLEQMDAAWAWITKVRRNAIRVAEAQGDMEVLHQIDIVCGQVAEQLLVAKHAIVEIMTDYGYGDDHRTSSRAQG